MALLIAAGAVHAALFGNSSAIDTLNGTFGPEKSIAQIRLSNTGEPIFRVMGAPAGTVAVYDSSDTTSVDNGTTVLVDAGGRRYVITQFSKLLLSPLG